MKNIVSNTVGRFDQIHGCTLYFWDNVEFSITNQINCLSSLIKNYPELSATIHSYKLDESVKFPQDNPHVILPIKAEESFISFFLKYVCYLYNFSFLDFLENLISNENPILIEFQGKPLLLSAYNERVIMIEILSILKDLSERMKSDPESLVIPITFEMLISMAVQFVGSSNDENQESIYLKMNIIQELYSACMEICAIEILNHDFQLIYDFLNQLTIIQTKLRAKIETFGHSQSLLKKLNYKSDFAWICLALKEATYNAPKYHFQDVPRVFLQRESIQEINIPKNHLNTYSEKINVGTFQGKYLFIF